MKKFALLIASIGLVSPISANAQNSVTMQAGEEPAQKPWTQPAQISFTSAKGQKDSWALDAALRAQYQYDNDIENMIITRAVAQINTQEKSKVQNFEGEVGYLLDWEVSEGKLHSYVDFKLGAKDKTIFADPKANCAVVPVPVACGKQHETSLTGNIVVQPHMPDWGTTFRIEDGKPIGEAIVYSFSPLITLFYDEILSAKVNASGIQPHGSVAGSKIELKTSFSPRFTDYRLVLRASGGWTYAVQRNALRIENFKKSTTNFKVSADYELGKRAFEEVGEGGAFIPAVGVTYTKGDDPLSGKLDQDNFVIAFKLAFRSK